MLSILIYFGGPWLILIPTFAGPPGSLLNMKLESKIEEALRHMGAFAGVHNRAERDMLEIYDFDKIECLIQANQSREVFVIGKIHNKAGLYYWRNNGASGIYWAPLELTRLVDERNPELFLIRLCSTIEGLLWKFGDKGSEICQLTYTDQQKQCILNRLKEDVARGQDT